MKLQEQKEKFILLRAEGKSYRAIASEIGICKSTAQKWGIELDAEIAELKQEQLKRLYDTYYMTKEARIKSLGGTLQRINTALDSADLEGLSVERLFYYKLQYTQALKDEYIQPSTAKPMQGFTPKDIMQAYTGLYNRVQAGEITIEQATKESSILGNMLKAYEAQELQKRIEALEAGMGGWICF